MTAAQWGISSAYASRQARGEAQNAKSLRYCNDEKSIIAYLAVLMTARSSLKSTRAVLNVDNLKVDHEGVHQPSCFSWE
jgi:hypothetical protein